MTIRRANHWTDAPHGEGRRRTLSNWLNFWTQGQGWAPCAPAATPAQGTPPNWPGQFDFSHGSQAAALQCFFRDATDPGNRAMVGARLSARPGSWLNLKALDCTAADVELEAGNARWPDLWAQTDLIFRPGRGKLQKEIICKAPGHPLVFRFTVKIAPGHTFEVANGLGRLLDEGSEVLELRSPFASDANGEAIQIVMRASNPVGPFQVVELALDPADLAGAVYPVTVDPTVVISGTTDIEDNLMYQGGVTTNYGGAVFAIFGLRLANQRTRTLFRIDESTIPSGSITAFRMLAWRYSNAFSANPGTLEFYIIKDANDWVEGTSGGGPQAGSACWNQAKYLSQNWAGSVGCGTSGVDYDADASPPSWPYLARTAGPDVLHTIPLDAAWPPLWRDAARVNNGIIGFGDEITTSTQFFIRSSESAGNPLSFEIDYTELPKGAKRGIGRGLRRGVGRGF